MIPYQPRSRLGTSPDPVDDLDEQESPVELGLSIRLDQPFHELKERLVSEFERAYLARCLAASESLSAASRMSGLSRKHIRTLMTKYGLMRRAELELELDDGAGDPGTDSSPEDCDFDAERVARGEPEDPPRTDPPEGAIG